MVRLSVGHEGVGDRIGIVRDDRLIAFEAFDLHECLPVSRIFALR